MNRLRFGLSASIAYGLMGLAAAGLAGLSLWQMRPSGAPDPIALLPLAVDFRGPALTRKPDAVALRRYAQARLRLSPADPGAWTTLAYAARAEAGECSRACAEALGRSYDAAPLDPAGFAWRTRFALENWQALTPALRDRAIGHMRQAWSTTQGRAAMRDMARTVVNPNGRLAVRAVAASLKSQPLARRTG